MSEREDIRVCRSCRDACGEGWSRKAISPAGVVHFRMKDGSTWCGKNALRRGWRQEDK